MTAPKGAEPPKAPMTPEQQALAVAYLPFAQNLAQHQEWLFPQHDEWHAVARLALAQAARSYDPSRGVKFPTFAAYRIAGAFRDECRRITPFGFRGVAGTDAPTIRSGRPGDEEIGTVLFARRDRPVEEVAEADDALEWWFRRLPPLHADVFSEHYRNGLSLSEVAAKLGLRPGRVAKLHAQGLRLLRDEAELARRKHAEATLEDQPCSS